MKQQKGKPMARRGRPRKQPEPEAQAEEPAAPEQKLTNGYTITKPHDKYVVKLGGHVVYTSDTDAQAQKYVEMTKGRG
jgi:hypothetical protein